MEVFREILNTCRKKINYNTLLLQRQLLMCRTVKREMARTIPNDR